RILVQLRDAALLAQEAAQGKIGHLAVAYAPSCSNVVVRVLRAFRKQFSNVKVSLRSMPPGQQPEALRRDHIDVGFSVFPIDDEGLVTELISRERLMVVMSEHH